MGDVASKSPMDWPKLTQHTDPSLLAKKTYFGATCIETLERLNDHDGLES